MILNLTLMLVYLKAFHKISEQVSKYFFHKLNFNILNKSGSYGSRSGLPLADYVWTETLCDSLCPLQIPL